MGQRELANLEVFNDEGHDIPYIPQCDSDGLFEPLQRSDNGSSWCVNPVDGKVISDTFHVNSIAICGNTIFHFYQEYIRLGRVFYVISLVDNKHYDMCNQWDNVKHSSRLKFTLMENGLYFYILQRF